MQSGDACPNPKCKGRLRVRTSEPVGESYVQRLECNACGEKHGKVVVPAARVWQRRA